MNFVDADRLFVPLVFLTFLDRFIVAPFETIEVEDQRGCLDSVLPIESERVAFQDDLPKAGSHFNLVMSSFRHTWDEDLPDPSFDPFSHGMAPAVPAVEITYDADALRIGGPDGKSRTCVPVDLGQVRAQFLVDIIVVTFLVEVHVQLAENGTIGVRIAN